MRTTQVHLPLNEPWYLPGAAELDSDDTLVLLFSDAGQAAVAGQLARLRPTWPRAHWVGCSTAGNVAGALVQDAGVSITVARFEHTRLRTATAPLATNAASFAAGAALAKTLSGADLRVVLVTSDGLNSNGSELVRGLVSALPPEVVVTGGLAADSMRFQSTWVLAGGEPQAGVVSAVGLYGDRLCVGNGVGGGWSDFGPERRVTRSEGNVLYELDGQPALDLYCRYLGERASGLPGTALLFPLSIRQPDDPRSQALVRTVLAVNRERGSMSFAGDIPQGCVARLMRAGIDRLIHSAEHAVKDVMCSLAGPGDSAQPRLALAVGCVGRRTVLGERTEEELELLCEAISQPATVAGFYAFGEIGSAGAHAQVGFHNQSMAVTVLQEH